MDAANTNAGVDDVFRCEICLMVCNDEANLKEHVVPHLEYCQLTLYGHVQQQPSLPPAVTCLKVDASTNTEHDANLHAALNLSTLPELSLYDAGDDDVKPRRSSRYKLQRETKVKPAPDIDDIKLRGALVEDAAFTSEFKALCGFSPEPSIASALNIKLEPSAEQGVEPQSPPRRKRGRPRKHTKALTSPAAADDSVAEVKRRNSRYTCNVCHKQFELKSALHAHRVEHLPFACQQCGKGFKTEKSFKLHEALKHSDAAPLECDVCKRVFFDAEKVEKHKRIRHNDGKLHAKIVHGVTKYYRYTHACSVCDKTFTTRASLRTHSLIHTGEKPFQCDQCEAAFRQRSNLVKHMILHTGEKNFKCDICDRSFSTQPNLRQHMRRHGARNFVCDLCGHAFPAQYALNSHMKSVHSGVKPFECAVCQKRFSNRGILTAHERVHTGERPFKCELCGGAFKQKGSLQKHMLQVHSEGSIFQCDICAKECKTQESLKLHRRMHTGENCFDCQDCGKRFPMLSMLKHHSRVHTGERRYACEQCGKRLSTAGGLARHRMIHTGEKPFHCDQCSFTCRVKNDLTYHLMIHSGTKNYQCEVCFRWFIRPDYLRTHMRIHKNDNNVSTAAGTAAGTAASTAAIPSAPVQNLVVSVAELTYI